MFNKKRQEIQENQLEINQAALEMTELSNEEAESLTGGYFSVYSSLGQFDSGLKLSGSFLSSFQSRIVAVN